MLRNDLWSPTGVSTGSQIILYINDLSKVSRGRERLAVKEPEAALCSYMSICISICGVAMWNGLEENTKPARNADQLQKKGKKKKSAHGSTVSKRR